MIKFADEVIKEIEKRGKIEIPEGYVTGEAFEKWLYENKKNVNTERRNLC